MWTLREIKIRYKQSIVGGLWAILQPLSLMIVFAVVYFFLTGRTTGDVPYPVFSYTALLPWTFFATSLSFAVPSLVTNMNLVTKIRFPREILPMASVGAAFLDFAIASVVFVGLLLVYRIQLAWTVLWVPFLLILQVLLTLGLVFALSATNVFYRDIRFVMPLAVQIWMYATPIIYPVSAVPERLRALYMLNPMAGLIDSYRRVILLGQPPLWSGIASTIVVALVAFFGGYIYFKRAESVFADII
jgi:lipopolysaccharide transport system permease protein